jgi:ATP-dependent RNA helicase SUPV3L1/SUV3
MLAHRSGMIGLPLRLLAREVYDKVARLKGAQSAALVTGEEKIVPPHARYFVCTVEAMPLDISVACLVIDEIQLATDQERGHVFTDRLLHARGEEETILLGSDTMRGAVQRFIPGVWFMGRPRFSDLAYTGAKKLTRLPRRSAVVAFSVEEVYAIAELVRRQHGGAAVVLGALSPRTRNAQVALYQSGDVDFLVATDAIGMGLNMDVDHVAFAALEKFDGTGMRGLTAEEAGQIAGRAGRHMNDGTFGVTAGALPLDEEIVGRVETHRYDPARALKWRNSRLEFQSLDALLESLDAPPDIRGLSKARPAIDLTALRDLARSETVRARVMTPAAVRKLWDVCQLPDFRKLSIDEHVHLIQTIHEQLTGDSGALDDDWMARQIARLDHTEGDVATLSGRLAHIRTWTYAAHRPGWVRDGAYWQGLTRALEDRLSDALHDRLTERFIDRRSTFLMRRLREDEFLDAVLDDSGGVTLSGEIIGTLKGFRFATDPRADATQSRTLRAAAARSLLGEFHVRTTRLGAAPDAEISLSEHGKFWWDGAIVGRLEAGAGPLRPRAVLDADDILTGTHRERVEQRLGDWMRQRIEGRLKPLVELQAATEARAGSSNALPAIARGIAHRLIENFGSMDREEAGQGASMRILMRTLKPFGVWIGRRAIYVPKLLRPDSASLLVLLWGVWARFAQLPAPPQPSITSIDADPIMPTGFYRTAGFAVVAGRAVRFDILERLEDELEIATKDGTGIATLRPRLVSLLGCSNERLAQILGALGWQSVEVAGNGENAKGVFRNEAPKGPAPRVHRPAAISSSPFAGLERLLSGK